MFKLRVISGEGLNPRKADDLPAIIHMDPPKDYEEWLFQQREVEEYERYSRGFRGIVEGGRSNLSSARE